MTHTRREAILRLATLIGAAVAGPRLHAANFTLAGEHGFSASEIALLDEIGDTIIPSTDVPGAKATGIGAFMAMMVNHCHEAAEQAVFKAGLRTLAATFRARFGTEFTQGSSAQRIALLAELDREQLAHTATRPRNEPPHSFRLMKELTLLGYFTSEIGATQALRYEEVPGRFNGNAPYRKGDRIWIG